MGSIIGIIIALVIALIVRNDAKSRGMKHLAWSAGVFLLLIVFLPLYFILRKPKLDDHFSEEREEVFTENESGEIQRSEAEPMYITSFPLLDKYRFLPHLLLALIWTLFSIWICAREKEFASMVFLIFLGFLPFLLEKFETEIFRRARNK